MTKEQIDLALVEKFGAWNGKLRPDLTEEQKLEAARIGRIEFKSAGAKRCS